MHFIDRYLLSMVVGTAVLVVLALMTTFTWGALLEMPHTWFIFAGVNTLRLTFTRNRIVGA